MSRKALITFSLASVVVVVAAASVAAKSLPFTATALVQGQAAGGALSKDRLIKLLKLGDSSQQELAQAVARKGVDFQPTADDEKELRQAGASDELIAAVRANFRGAANDGGANAAQNNAQVNQPDNAQPAQNDAQQSQPTNAAAGAQGGQAQAAAAPEAGFRGFQVGTYKGDAKDNRLAAAYGVETQKLEFKIDRIDADTGKVHAGFFAEHYRSWDLNGTIDEEGTLRLEGSPVSPGLKIVAHASGGVITAKYRDESHGVDGGEFTVKFAPDEFGDEFNKKSAPPGRNN
jgi:hypothetical protein